VESRVTAFQKAVKPERLPEPRKRARMMQGRAVRKTEKIMSKKTWGAVDVSKPSLDAAVEPSAQRWKVSNNRLGIREMIKRVKAINPAGVVVEGTGGWEKSSVKALAKVQVPVRD